MRKFHIAILAICYGVAGVGLIKGPVVIPANMRWYGIACMAIGVAIGTSITMVATILKPEKSR
jgi:hypothetical protein